MSKRFPQKPITEGLMTPREVAEFGRISTRTVRRLVAEGLLPVVLIGRLPRFRPLDVRDLFRPD